MCTLYWESSPNLVRLFFNRDEQRTRPMATPLAQRLDGEYAPLVFAQDPKGRGTWLGSNPNTGIVVALLNYYPVEKMMHKKGERSRGLLVLDLLKLPTIDIISDTLQEKTPLSHYARFHLVVISLKTSILFTWDGNLLRKVNPAPHFLTTSSVCPEAIIPIREAALNKILPQGISAIRDLFLTPSNSAEGICMDREDARTLSFTEIEMREDSIRHSLSVRQPNGDHFDPQTVVVV